MTRLRWLLVLLPGLLTLCIVLLLDYLDIVQFSIVFHADIDVILLAIGFGISIIAAIWLMLRHRMNLLYRQNLALARSEATAERIRFLRRLDHEMKNHLTAIRAALANLADIDDQILRVEVLDGIEIQVMRLSLLIVSLRKLANMESHSLEQSRIDLYDLLDEAMIMAREEPGAETRVIRLVATSPLPSILGEQDLLLLCLYNLLNNAVKFTRPGNAIELRAYPTIYEDCSCVVIEVADEGPGIPESDLPHIWEELYRGQMAYGTQGSGIGLAMVKSVVERHGGWVSVRSQLGEGTTFMLTLPVSDVTE